MRAGVGVADCSGQPRRRLGEPGADGVGQRAGRAPPRSASGSGVGSSSRGRRRRRARRGGRRRSAPRRDAGRARKRSTYSSGRPNDDCASRCAAASASATSSGPATTRMPRPPPPCTALTASGQPSSSPNWRTASGSSTANIAPGTGGTPASVATCRAASLSPIIAITSADGPMNVSDAALDGGGEVGAFGEEPVAGMHGVAPCVRRPRRRPDRCRGRCRRQPIRGGRRHRRRAPPPSSGRRARCARRWPRCRGRGTP